MRKIVALSLLLLAAAAFSCNGRSEAVVQNPNDTPTEAYKRLFAAIKAKNSDAIRKEMSEKTQQFAKAVSEKQKKPEVEVLSNGFTATTFAPTLPEIRDERINDKMGAIEVWNSTDKRWEDLPFVREADGWKLAVGDLFSGTFKSPGKGQAQREQEAANSMSPTNGMQLPPGMPNSNTNANFNRPANLNRK